MKPGTQQDFLKKPIHEAWERLKESRSCERFFVDILLEQADLLLVTLVREAFFYSLLANFATRTASYIFFLGTKR